MMITRYPAFSSLIFICILIFSISITISTSSAQDDEDQRYQDCSTEIECGALSFGFPFSGSNRPSYCGLPEFNLTCNDRIPTISIADITYRILDINNNSQILTLLQADYARDLCPADPRNATEVLNLFEFTADTQLLTLYYGCQSLTGGFPRPPTLGSFNCPSQLDDYFVPTDSALEAYETIVRMWLGGCRNRVRVPVNQTAVVSLESNPTVSRLTETINQGFGMRWPAGNDSLCATCRLSGGQCGFNDTTRSFTCFCVDRPCLTAATGPTAQPDKKEVWIIIGGVLAAGGLLATLVFIIQIKRKKLLLNGSNCLPCLSSTPMSSDNEDIELPLFDLTTIVSATNNFSPNNILGRGGFGIVYKGTLRDGVEIAVKKLSRNSQQGANEFKNEAINIAKLQHRNLVRLLGCCVQHGERMLLYEFMPNGSLDAFIFDKTQSHLLDWPKRYNIIRGIARGLLYLHQDSRLRIIHRDLKASNVLLDNDMNPKISDFGLAKIFVGNTIQENTRNVVGTYGYMSPEYTIDGIYSIKSDVFSFGVMVLEIVSGKRNRGFHHPEHQLNLLGHAWMLHREDRDVEMIDETMGESYEQFQVMRLVHIGLLCVQKSPEDRPTMLTVMHMLYGEGHLEEPKQPGFFTERDLLEESSLSGRKGPFTNATITISMLLAR